MFGPVHGAHPALAEYVEEPVVPEDQVVGPALADRVHLEPGQQVQPEQFGQERVDRGEPGEHVAVVRRHLFPLFGHEHLRGQEPGEEGLGRGHRRFHRTGAAPDHGQLQVGRELIDQGRHQTLPNAIALVVSASGEEIHNRWASGRGSAGSQKLVRDKPAARFRW